ncbi:hypothetical protein [Streptomyces venezuelae]|uniref:hypothetical protein n=1 Tax=Streptomyces venezuelae TaxID=54571 RepID=UPI0037D5FACF
MIDHRTTGADWKVVNTYGDLPSTSSEEHSSFIFATQVFGDQFMAYFKCVGIVREFEERVDAIEHAYGFYLQERWDLLDSVMRRSFEDAWPKSPSVLDRHTYLHRILSVLAAALDPNGFYPRAKRELWSRTFGKEENFSELAFRVTTDSNFEVINRRLSDQLVRLLRDAADWIPALAIAHLRAGRMSIPEDWRVPLVRIDTLRDAYRQNFEVSCQMLPLVVRMQNMTEGRDIDVIRDPGLPGGWAPRTLLPRDLVNNVNQYTKAKASTKEAYLNRNSRLRHFWNSAFTRDVRNGIAHAEFDYVMHDGIVRYKDVEVPQYVFVEALIQQIALLVFWLDLCKLCKIYGSRWDPVRKNFLGLA